MAIGELERRLLLAKSTQEALDVKKKWNDEFILPIQNQLLAASNEEKRDIGKKLNVLKNQGNEIFNQIKNRLELGLRVEKVKNLDLSVSNYDFLDSSFNPLCAIRSQLIEIFNNLGFFIESGKEIVTVEENFENLKVPDDHPSRSPLETFYIDSERLLRPHCTVHSINYLKKIDKNLENVRLATIGSVYRRDDETSRHTHQFSQLDFLWLQKGLTVSNLKNFLEFLFSSLFGKSKEFRFRNSYFPFTQPSVELDMRCNCGEESNCSICGGSGWIEILGAGLFRREILSEAGFSEEYECLAGGLGLERLALIKYEISDIRYLYENNFEFLKCNCLDDCK
ncbi:phenylalanine--tRNA ligase subunit alpha [Candidatus Mycoplasma haematohominis]|uniref:phenylalanine--tRNA ligase n=1 Tax=Candidatus Mycoplasma haematohominis TaxID=1494318 RepID=A0A478FTF0_9MOLU|nr:phenylalanine--tRNA ligase subunit alpha [Candidatus Mycoplasma haemohominis]GCE63290.1 phenylalanine--tRNA ligase alpha subunit [Candidatus Mycoplasma haemohominis]